MKTEELIKTLPLEVMRDLTTEKRKEIIQSLEEPKIYGSEKYTHQELAIHQCFLVDQAEDAFEEAEKKCDKKRTEIKETQKALDLAKAEYEKAAQKMNAIQEELDKKRAELEEAESDRKAKEDAFVKEETLAKEMKTIVVVHSSATFEQLKGHMHSVISITGSDKDVLDILKPQNVFGKPKAYKWLKNIPESLKKLPDGKRKDSIMEYCEMALDLSDLKKTNKDKNVVLLYNDQIIRETLEANGLSEF